MIDFICALNQNAPLVDLCMVELQLHYLYPISNS